ncbi:hypothetical protein [Metabacillus iocasae]|uniref:Uncharacterized protein n=1 Tax=Priestia iocasae TaxID=2291674 RepID=A0ABS2QT07_9BACI|nr:hypothetical protein [Metabacillus iocasae]MBM7702413.1 hypothetical protein [Metabacillus iocasae]
MNKESKLKLVERTRKMITQNPEADRRTKPFTATPIGKSTRTFLHTILPKRRTVKK